MRQETEKAFGIPVWDLHTCDICGSVLLFNTLKLHAEFHKTQVSQTAEPKFMPKDCPICGETINIQIDIDGSMMLDIYDEHLDSHEEE